MKLINKSVRAYIAFDTVIKAGEVIETDDKKVINILLSQPGVEEHVDKQNVKTLEEENKKLKEQLETKKATKKVTKKGNSK